MVEPRHIAVVAPRVSAGGVGAYAGTLRDRMEATGVRTTLRPIGDGVGVAATARAGWRSARDSDVHLHFEYGFFRPKLLLAWVFLLPLWLGRAVWRRRVVVTVHEVWTPETVGWVQYAYVWLVHSLLAATATDLVFMTREATRDFGAAVTPRTHLIPHGVPVSDRRELSRAEARETFGYDREATVVAQIGYVSDRKGTDEVVTLAERHPDTEFLIAGGPRRPEDEPYVDRIEATAGPNVRVTGVLDDDAFHHAFVAADVAVLAYRDIRQSGILNWCFAYGLPAVCRSIPRFRTVAERCEGVVLFGEGEGSIDDALTAALTDRDALSEAMRAYADRNSLDDVASSYLSVLGPQASFADAENGNS
ncbi:MAG: glycosyltransferase [Halobaculum sp.]